MVRYVRLEIFKNTYFEEYLQTAASDKTIIVYHLNEISLMRLSPFQFHKPLTRQLVCHGLLCPKSWISSFKLYLAFFLLQ